MRSCLYVLLLLTVLCSCGDTTLFKKISADHSGITFNNVIKENDSINPLDLEFLYNGGGVAVGDFNNDSLPDLYFTASTTSNKLYLNKGDFKFEDITNEAKVAGAGEWANAASIVDINNDGLEDIYVCNTIKSKGEQRRNLLYINQGLDKNKVPVFKESASEYGLADTSFSVQAAFFDYDNDGDLDMYLVTTKLAKREAATFNSSSEKDTSTANVDKLFRNDWDSALGHPIFTDVSKASGITEKGFGLGITVADINKDGWKDVYVTNDFFGSDVLYINNRNGTFSNKVKEYFKHTSQNAMGNDIADFNNDGLADVVTVDMNPEDNYRKKKNMSGNNYFLYQNMLYQGIMLQYVRNTLQLNMGPRVNGDDSIGSPVFSDISFHTNTAETDWSWNPSLADFDNDGQRDLIITNGYPRDVTDHDFAAFRSRSLNIASKDMLLEQIPVIKIPNYAFKNTGNLGFKDVTKTWGLDEPSFSNGAVYVDLDNDGDLDYVINNINEVASVYENTTNNAGKVTANFIEIGFKGDNQNKKGLGAWAELYYNGKMQVAENLPVRGYLSCIDSRLHFGLDSIATLDSIVIRWPNHTKQVLQNVRTNQILAVDVKNANIPDDWSMPAEVNKPLFTEITKDADLHYIHSEIDYIDFDRERLLPHKLSEYDPGLATGDVDGNGLDDIYIGGTGNNTGKFFLQQPSGKFIMKNAPADQVPDYRNSENLGVLLFDADNDGDLDMYCANGSNQYQANTSSYQDHFFVNKGGGVFQYDAAALPENFTSKSCVKAFDFDNDGDLDLFVGGRCLPGQYPMPVSSFIYRNDSEKGKVKFTDVTTTVCKGLDKIGMVCDAVWTDFDNDGQTDLIVTGEWMPVTFFKNNHGKFENVTQQTGIASQVGWWTSLAAGDFDNDGDIDYIAGNLGLNSFFRASDAHPVNVYAKDFDGNGSVDAILTVYMKDQKGVLKEYTALNRDDIVGQLPGMKKKFLTYKEFGEADVHQMFTDEQMKGALKLSANNFANCYIENKGNGKFQLHALPVLAQMAPLNGLVVDDFNHDGNLDVAMVGNDFGNEISAGRYDAMNGLVLLGDGAGNFTPQSILQSGLFVPGDAKALVKLRGANNTYLLAASQNKSALKLFKSNNSGVKMVPLQPADKFIYTTLANGKTRKEEVYYGTSFLSQSAHFICVDSSMKKVEVVNTKGEKRLLQ